MRVLAGHGGEILLANLHNFLQEKTNSILPEIEQQTKQTNKQQQQQQQTQ